jgi:hypothetical protein
MEFCHTDTFLHSPSGQRLFEFVQERREKWAMQTDWPKVDTFESFEQDLHRLVMALECELVSEELSRYDMAAQEIEAEGKVYRRGIRLPETYLTAAGRVSVERHLYSPVGEKGPSICPLELRSGIIAGYFTPRAARQGAFMMAHLTPGESEDLFGEIGNMQPSRSKSGSTDQSTFAALGSAACGLGGRDTPNRDRSRGCQGHCTLSGWRDDTHPGC